ncbi:hypothetical protein AB0K18_36525 [Nonomuraea sp. NPDC049421]
MGIGVSQVSLYVRDQFPGDEAFEKLTNAPNFLRFVVETPA